MLRLAASLALTIVSGAAAYPQEHAIADAQNSAAESGFEEFSADLADLQAAFSESEGTYATLSAAEQKDFWARVVDRAAEMKRRWDENSPVQVTGFSVTLGFPPSVDVQFEFNE